jgi:DNA polymerase-3 subunit beta
MKITVHKENLQRALGFVEKVTSKSTALPILSNILLKTERGRLKISATNLEVGVTSLIGANIEKEGHIAVPGRILSDCVRGVKGDTITLTTEQNTLTINTGTFTTTLLGFDAAEYPIIPKVESSHLTNIDARILQKMIIGVIDSIALSESRPELAGALLNFQPTETILAATDSFRLAEYRSEIPNPQTNTVIIPRGTISEVSRIISDVDGEISITIADNQIAFAHEDFEIVSRLIDGRYPDYTKVIPERYTTKVLVRKDEIENAIKIAALFSSSISDIKILCESDGIQLSAKNSTKGEAHATVPANIKGDSFEVTVNYHYFLDGLKVIPTDKVVLEFTGKGSPFVLRPHD